MFKKYLLSICVASILLFIGLYVFVFQNQAVYDDEGTSAYILDEEQRDIYTKKTYQNQGFYNIKIKTSKVKKLNSNNYNQEDLIKYYNKNNQDGADINKGEGICWAVAMTSLLDYYGCESDIKDINKRSEIISKKVLDIAKKEGYWYPNTNGVSDSEEDDILDDVFASYGGKYKKYDANSDTFNLYKTIRKEVNAGRVSILSIIEHAMAACGYEEYAVTYKYRNWIGWPRDGKATSKYVVVNSAKDNYLPYHYYPEDQILTGIFDRWDFTVTKIIK